MTNHNRESIRVAVQLCPVLKILGEKFKQKTLQKILAIQERKFEMGGLIGALFGGRRRYNRNVGLFGGNRGYAPQRRRGLLSNPIVGALAVGALGYAANRFFGNNQRSQAGGLFGGLNDPASRGGLGSSDWGNTDSGGSGSFNQNDGQSW
jgi:hypothetical protein